MKSTPCLTRLASRFASSHSYAAEVTVRNTRSPCQELGIELLLATRFLLKPRSANRESRGLPARSPGPCGANPVAAGRGDA